jgi:hypothetical protein
MDVRLLAVEAVTTVEKPLPLALAEAAAFGRGRGRDFD